MVSVRSRVAAESVSISGDNLVRRLVRRFSETGASIALRTRKPRASRAFLEAAEGTRTLDLLHGNRAARAGSAPFSLQTGIFRAAVRCTNGPRIAVVSAEFS